MSFSKKFPCKRVSRCFSWFKLPLKRVCGRRYWRYNARVFISQSCSTSATVSRLADFRFGRRRGYLRVGWYLSPIKSGRFGNGTTHRDRAWIGRSTVGAGSAAVPTAENVTTSRGCADRNNRSAVLPAASGGDRASGSVILRQVILCRKGCGVSLVGSRSNGVRVSSAITPLGPHVPHACRTVLWRSCGDRVT